MPAAAVLSYRVPRSLPVTRGNGLYERFLVPGLRVDSHPVYSGKEVSRVTYFSALNDQMGSKIEN